MNMEDSSYREAYPEELNSVERVLLEVSRQARGKELREDNKVGIGLSGGGIRSATFCLGVFQGLASLKLLRSIDFISTVSGGGYFGAFYNRLFLRAEIPNFAFVEETLDPCSEGKTVYKRAVFNWLRANGGYLAPRGSGDLLFAGAVLLRNWVAVQVIVVTFFLLWFLSAQLLHFPLDALFLWMHSHLAPESEMVITLQGNVRVWLSSFVLVPLLLFLVWTVPAGWSYWLIGRQPGKGVLHHPLVGVIFAALLGSIAVVLPGNEKEVQLAGAALLITSACTAAFWLASQKIGSRRTTGWLGNHDFVDAVARNAVSATFKAAAVTTCAALLFTIFDSLGQTIYVALANGKTLWAWVDPAKVIKFLIALIGSFATIVTFATDIVTSARAATGRRRPRGVIRATGTLAALFTLAVGFTTFSIITNFIAWHYKVPASAPRSLTANPPEKLMEKAIVPDKTQPNNWSIAIEKPQTTRESGDRDMNRLWIAWCVSWLLSLLFGQCWPFLNRSTNLPLYAGRLTRAYLGASNPRRFESGNLDEFRAGAVTRVIPGDDIDISYYWPWCIPGQDEPKPDEGALGTLYAKGAPLHLVNVTINETVDAKSQVQRQDFKGIGMALGPAGISVGVRHHVVNDQWGKRTIHPHNGFRVFHYRNEESFWGERLSLGQWLTISGTPLAPGLGARTNWALSFLTSIGNIRLGYWWDSGVNPGQRYMQNKRTISDRLGKFFTSLFPVHSYLMDEFLARYHGTARRHWYLSDGGQFENMGGYELIRRRLRLIVIVDSEADPDYTFGGLGDLIRKARIDFGAEITFLDEPELEKLFPKGHSFGTLENLRRGKRVAETLPFFKKMVRMNIDVDTRSYSLAHAAIARVTYDGKEHADSCLIYLKPTLIGDEPVDVLQYHVDNPRFPQQATIDLFFDEAQWESYRALGEHIAREVFRAPEGEDPERWCELLVQRVLGSK